MEVRKFIRPDITVSAVAHLSALACVILYAEVHPFAAVTQQQISVDLVTPEEVDKLPDPPPTPTPPTPDLSILTKPVTPAEQPQSASPPQAPSPPQASSPPPQQKQAAQPARPDRRE